jgi:hypothetical protein
VSLRSMAIPAILMHLSGSVTAYSGPQIPGTDGLTLGALLSMCNKAAGGGVETRSEFYYMTGYELI